MIARNYHSELAIGAVGHAAEIECVACCYVLTTEEMRLRIESLARNLGVRVGGVIVSNRMSGACGSAAGWDVIDGSNRTHDFSAYFEGVTHLLAKGRNLNNVVFINDSVFTSHHPRTNLAALFRQLSLLEKIQCPAIVGKTDSYHTFCHSNPWSGLAIFVSTYCFALNRSALPILQGLEKLADSDLGDSDSTVSIQSPQWGVGLTATFREFVRGFLLYGHPDYRWPGADKYRLDDELVSKKARCIYLEHRLSGEIGRLGCILPTNLTRMDRVRFNVSERIAQWARKIGLQPK